VTLYLALAGSSFAVAWILGEVGRIVDRRHRLDAAEVVRIVGGYAAAARQDLTGEIPVVREPAPWPLPPIHTCKPPHWYVPILDRPAEFDRLIGVEFPLCSYVESAT
jgi:hypothetical protein